MLFFHKIMVMSERCNYIAESPKHEMYEYIGRSIGANVERIWWRFGGGGLLSTSLVENVKKKSQYVVVNYSHIIHKIMPALGVELIQFKLIFGTFSFKILFWF